MCLEKGKGIWCCRRICASMSTESAWTKWLGCNLDSWHDASWRGITDWPRAQGKGARKWAGRKEEGVFQSSRGRTMCSPHSQSFQKGAVCSPCHWSMEFALNWMLLGLFLYLEPCNTVQTRGKTVQKGKEEDGMEKLDRGMAREASVRWLSDAMGPAGKSVGQKCPSKWSAREQAPHKPGVGQPGPHHTLPGMQAGRAHKIGATSQQHRESNPGGQKLCLGYTELKPTLQEAGSSAYQGMAALSGQQM